MANVFKNALARDIGTSAVTLYSAPASKNSICIELDVCNTTNSAVSCSAFITKGGADYYIVKNAPVPVGGTLQIIAGQKIVLSDQDAIKIISTATTSLDAVASILEDV